MQMKGQRLAGLQGFAWHLVKAREEEALCYAIGGNLR